MSNSQSTTSITDQLQAKFGLQGIEFRHNLTKEELFHEAIANDRGRVSINGDDKAQKALSYIK